MPNVEPPSPGSALSDPALPPPPLFALIGREQELTQSKHRLLIGIGNAALTVLYGLPGVGKTALATVLAHDPEIRASFSDGILWVGLGPNPNIPSELRRWGRLVGLEASQMATLSGDRAWASAIRIAIGSRRMLLVIDDAWDFSDVQALRVGAPNCAHLITTRHPAIAAQITPNIVMIGEFDEEKSLQLLERLAPQVVEQEETKVREFVRVVGGLPLALTLLGNYLRRQTQHSNETLSAVLQRLGNAQVRFQISEAHTPIEGPPIETSRSLQAVIAITNQWLPEPAREALYTLSIFPPKPHTFTEEAAIAATACTYDELDVLSDAGLLEYHGGRCTLHQVIADYAQMCLPNQEADVAHNRLITYIADFVEAHKKDYELLDLESHIIFLALSQAHAQGKQRELIRIVCAFAPFLILRGFYQEAEHHLQRAKQAARALNDDDAITATLLYLGEIEQRLGNYPQATTSLQEGLTLARQMDNNEQICALLTQLGIVLQEQGNFQQAETAYQEGLTLARNIAENESICTLLDNLGWLIMKRGEFAQSERYLQEGLTLARKINDRERVGGLLRRLGALEIYRGSFVQAQSYMQEGLALARQLGDREQICALLGNLGLVAAEQGKNAQAKVYYQEALELARQMGHREQICNVLINLGDVFIEEDNYIQAEISLREGLELARQIGHRKWTSILLISLGITTHKQGRYRDAERYLQESLYLASQIDELRITCNAFYEFGNLYLSMKNLLEAEKAFNQVLKLLPSGDQELFALAYYGSARVYALQGDRENARFYGNKSMTIFEAMGYKKVTEVRNWMKSALG